MKRLTQISALVLVIAGVAHGAESDFARQVDAFVEKHCYDCHDADTQKGDFRIDSLSRDLSKVATAIAWQDALDLVKQGEMPPSKKPRPDKAELTQFIAALEGALKHEAAKATQVNRIEIRRLSHSALDNTVADLLGTRLKLSDDLPADLQVAGFDNMAQTLGQSQEFLDHLQQNARRLAADVIVEGPDPRAVASFPVKSIGSGKKTTVADDEVILWSSKNRDNVAWPKGFVAPRAGIYRIELTAFERDNRHDLRTAGKRFESTMAKPGRSNQSLPPERPRMAAIMAMTADQVHGYGGPSTGGRRVGMVQVADHMTTVHVECLLEAGENIFVHASDAPRIQEPPNALVDGIEVLVGEMFHLKEMKVEGPLMESWPPALHQSLLGKNGSTSHNSEGLRTFLTRAFRRHADDATLGRYQKLFEQSVAAGASREVAMRNVVEAVLCSPRFLYCHDINKGGDASALASRMSYFLWNSMPDDALLKLAASGELLKPEVIESQARRMLANRKADRFVVDFAGQWLGLRKVGAMLPDPKLYPDYDPVLEASMRQETEALFREILSKNLPVSDFLKPGFAMLNERLARHYGIDGVTGNEIRRVALPPESPRGGLLGQASMLTITSNGTRTSPVVRGVWVLENLLDSPPAPPPPNVKPIEPDVRGAKTIREMLAKHREVETCDECHRRIDPWGFGLENFDAVGAWRDSYGGNRARDESGKTIEVALKPVDSSATLPNGKSFDGAIGMRDALLSRSDRFTHALAAKLLAHSLGHPTTFKERVALDEMVARHKSAGGGFADLIAALCTSEVFRGNKQK